MPRLRGTLGTLPLFKPRQLGPQRAVLFHQPMRLRLQLFEIGARLLQHLLFHRPRGFPFIQQLLVALLLLARPAAFLPHRSSSNRATDKRDCARVNSSANCRCS